MSESTEVSTPVGLLVLLLVLGGAAWFVVSDLTRYGSGRLSTNEDAARGALKAFQTAQSLFREGDKDQDGNFDYGSLRELSDTNLIDSVTGAGTKGGYTFAIRVAPQTPEFLWMAVASPEQPGVTGERYFATNHAGIIWYRTAAPFELRDDCAIPTTALPAGESLRCSSCGRSISAPGWRELGWEGDPGFSSGAAIGSLVCASCEPPAPDPSPEEPR